MKERDRIEQEYGEKVNIDGIELSDRDIPEHMEVVRSLFERDGFHAIGEVEISTLETMETDVRVRDSLAMLDLALIGDSRILAAAGLDNVHRRFEVDNARFCKELLFFLEETGKGVFLLGGNRRVLQDAEDFLRDKYPHLNILGADICVPEELRDEKESDDDSEEVVNEINSAGTDVIFSVLPTPEQELFLYENYPKISAKLWYGFGESYFVDRSGLTDQLMNNIRIRQLKKRIVKVHEC